MKILAIILAMVAAFYMGFTARFMYTYFSNDVECVLITDNGTAVGFDCLTQKPSENKFLMLPSTKNPELF